MEPSHNTSINTAEIDFENIYNANSGAVSNKISKQKLSLKPHHVNSQ